MSRAKWKGGPVPHDPTLRTKGGTPKRAPAKRTSPKEVTFGTLVVRELRRFNPTGLTALHDWDLPYYLQLAPDVTGTNKVAKTVRIGVTPTGHDVLADLDFGGRVLGIEVV
jgi:hypothetical protein